MDGGETPRDDNNLENNLGSTGQQPGSELPESFGPMPEPSQENQPTEEVPIEQETPTQEAPIEETPATQETPIETTQEAPTADAGIDMDKEAGAAAPSTEVGDEEEEGGGDQEIMKKISELNERHTRAIERTSDLIAAFKSERKLSAGEIKKLKGELSGAQEEIDGINSKYEELDDKYSALKKENKQLNTNYERIHRFWMTTREALEKRRLELVGVEEQLDKLETENKRLTGRVTALEDENKDLSQRVESHDRTLGAIGKFFKGHGERNKTRRERKKAKRSAV